MITGLVIIGGDHRPRYKREWERRKAEGHPEASIRLLKSRFFLIAAAGTVSGINGVPEPALHGISLPIQMEVEEGRPINQMQCILGAVSALSYLERLIAEGGDRPLRKLHRTIRVGASINAQYYLIQCALSDGTRKRILEAGSAYMAPTAYPSNFQVSEILWPATMGEVENAERKIEAVVSTLMTPIASPSEDDRQEEEGEDIDLGVEEKEADWGDEAEDGGDAGIAAPQEGEGAEASPDSEVAEMKPEVEWTILPVHHEVWAAAPSKDGGASGSRFGKVRVPHPGLVALHFLFAPLAYGLGEPIFLGIPLLAYYPRLIPLLGLMLLARAVHSWVISGAIRDPLLMISAYVGIAASATMCIWWGYLSHGHRMTPLKGLRGIFMLVAKFVGSAVSLIASLGKKGGTQGEAVTGGAIPIRPSSAGSSSGGFSVPIRADEVSDVLAVAAGLMVAVPPLHLLVFPFLSISISVERGDAFVAPILAVAAMVLRHFARSLPQHAVGVGLALLGVPGFQKVEAAGFAEEVRALLGAIRSLSKEGLVALHPRHWWQAIRRAFSRGVSVERHIPPPLQIPSLPEAAVRLGAMAEQAIGLRGSLERYLSALEAQASNPSIPRKQRAVYAAHAEYWREVAKKPLAIWLPSPGVTTTKLQLYFYRPALELPLHEPGASVRRSRRIFDMDDEDKAGPASGVRTFAQEIGLEEGEAGKPLVQAPAAYAKTVIRQIAQEKDFRRMQERGQILLKEDQLFLPNIAPLTDEKKQRWMNAVRERRFPAPSLAPKGDGIFVPLGWSSFVDDDGSHRLFGLMVGSKHNAHLVFAAPTGGGKTVAQRVVVLGAMRTFEREDLPWRVGIVGMDGKDDLYATLAPIAHHPAVLAPPLKADTSNPNPAIYYATAVYAALVARSEAYTFLSLAFSKARQDKALNERILRAFGANPAETEASAYPFLAKIFPGFAMAIFIIDEFWAIKESLGNNVRIQVLLDGEKVSISGSQIFEQVLTILLIQGRSMGIFCMPSTQSPRKEALDNSALRDNANLAIGMGVNPNVVNPLLTPAMNEAVANIQMVYHAVYGGTAKLPPKFCLLMGIRGSGLACMGKDGQIMLGGEERGGQYYGADIFYPPLVEAGDLATWDGKPVPSPITQHAALVADIVRFAASQGMEVPEGLKAFLKADAEAAALEFCQRALGCQVKSLEAMIRSGQDSIVSIASRLRSEVLGREGEAVAPSAPSRRRRSSQDE